MAKDAAQLSKRKIDDLARGDKEKEKEEERNLIKKAKGIAGEVLTFWGDIGKLVKFKHDSHFEKERQKVPPFLPLRRYEVLTPPPGPEQAP